MNLGYIAIEGPIGVGKTSLAWRLAETLGAELLLEQPEKNPFLGRFYQDPETHALATQLCFLLQRTDQIDRLRQPDLFAGTWVADFMFAKDRLFAELTLNSAELRLYEQVYRRLAGKAPVPDRVIYLHAPLNTLLDRIIKRARPEEAGLSLDYLARLSKHYAEFFRDYSQMPLIAVDAQHLDLTHDNGDYQALLDALAMPDRRINLTRETVL